MRIKNVNFLYLILGLLGFKSLPAAADTFLCAPEISGDVTAPRYLDCIDLSSWQWGAGVAISRTGQGVDFSTPSLSELTISKQSDSSSDDLLNYFTTHSVIPEFKLYSDECASCADGDPRVQVTLKDVYISGVSQSSGGTGLPSEAVSLNYGSIQWCYRSAGLKQPLECSNDIPVVPRR